MHHFSIPVKVERRAMVSIKAENLEDAIAQVKVLGVKNKITGFGQKNEGVVINYEDVEIYNPGYTLDPDIVVEVAKKDVEESKFDAGINLNDFLGTYPSDKEEELPQGTEEGP
jgi:hypothetical protein